MENTKMSTETVVGRLLKEFNNNYAEMGAVMNVSRTAVYKWHTGLARPTLEKMEQLIDLAKGYKMKLTYKDFLKEN
jgi:hypothetical protein